jgi:hypothetical protein
LLTCLGKCDRLGVSTRSWLGRSFANDLAVLNDYSTYRRARRNASHCLFGEI